MEKKIIYSILLLSAIFLCINSTVLAVPTFTSVAYYTEYYATWGDPFIIQFGALVEDDQDPNAEITSVVATGSDGSVYTLTELPTYSGDWMWGIASISGLGGLAAIPDYFTLTATSIYGQTDVVTHSLDNPTQLSPVSNLAVSDASLTPTVSWDPLAPFNDSMDYSIRLFDSSGVNFWRSDIINGTSFIIPDGVLSADEVYTIRLLANDRDLEADGHWRLENRSSADLSFNTAPVPEPATILLLGTGLFGLAAAGKKKFIKA